MKHVTTRLQDIKTDPELEAFLSPLCADERNVLVESVKAHGIIEPFIVWKGQRVLVDGYRRYRILLEIFGNDHNPALMTRELPFDSRNAVKEFMIKKQLGRRNLTKAERSKLALQLKPLFKAKAKENQRAGGKGLSNLSEAHTRKALAKEAGVSEGTLHKVEAVLESDDQQVKDDMLANRISIDAAHRAVKPGKKKPVDQKLSLEPPQLDRALSQAQNSSPVDVSPSHEPPPAQQSVPAKEAETRQEPAAISQPTEAHTGKPRADAPTHVNAENSIPSVVAGSMSAKERADADVDRRVITMTWFIHGILKELDAMMHAIHVAAPAPRSRDSNRIESQRRDR